MAKITFTINEISSIVDSLNTIVKTPMQAKYAFKFGKVAKSLQKDLDQFRLQRDALIRKYGKAEGDTIKVTPENSEKYAEEIKNLALQPIEIDFNPLPISVLGENKFTSLDMVWLDKFFYDDDEVQSSK